VEQLGEPAVNNTDRIKDIRLITESKNWCVWEFESGRIWYPGIHELGVTCALIGVCEDIKYPPPAKGARFFYEYLWESRTARTLQDAKIIYHTKFNPNHVPTHQEEKELNEIANRGWTSNG
jgi:hypothetical protein